MQVVDRFSAHLAHLLNSKENDETWIEPGAILADLLDLLASRYLSPLLFYSRYEWRMQPDEAATRYFDATLGRKLFLSGQSQYSSTHKVFLELVRRLPHSDWKSATLIRSPVVPTTDNKEPCNNITTIALQNRINKLCRTVHEKNSAAVLNKRDGPLWIVSGNEAIILPEEMSLWDAIITVPPKLQSLKKPESFNKFCGLIIDAMRTANRPFQEILGLGHDLCPFDWVTTLSTNQVRSLRRYLSNAKKISRSEQLNKVTAALLWKDSKVSGFRDFEEFWNSEVTRALRSPKDQIYLGELEDIPQDINTENTAFEILTKENEWMSALNEKYRVGLLNRIEVAIFENLYNGLSIKELETNIEIKNHFNKYGGSYEWLNKISNQLLKEVKRQ